MTRSTGAGRRAADRLVVALVAALEVGGLGATAAHAATFVVDDESDAVDASPGDAACATAGGACSLRAAVMETNTLPGAVYTSG